MSAITPEVRLRDVTLREPISVDGGILSIDDRLALLTALAAVPVAVAEVDTPRTAADAEFFQRATVEVGGPTELSVVGRIDPCDPSSRGGSLSAALSAGTGRVSAVVDGRVAPAAAAGCGPAETIAAVRDAVGLLLAEGRRVLLDVAHAVEAFESDPVCLVDLVATGLDAGADAVILDDSAGLALPDRVVAVTEAVAFSVGPGLGVACGDTSGCAVANSLLAVGAGARWVQTSVRPGTADLTTTILDLLRGPVADLRPVPDLAGLEATVSHLGELVGLPPRSIDTGSGTSPTPPGRPGASDAPTRPLAQA